MAMPYASLSPAGDYRSSPAATAGSLLPFCRSSPFSSAGGGNGVGEDAQMYGRWMARPLPFTEAQHEELRQQAHIYKHLVAGVPVPPELVLPIRQGLESLAARYYHNPLVAGYGSYFGKKIDPEPGRCRRTDGKKWRCAKEAASDSKYCERHMHRGRNRSRKPVETQLVPQPPAAAAATSPLGVVINGNAFQNHSLYPAIGGNNNGGAGGGGNSNFSSGLGSSQSQLHMGNASPYAALPGGAGGTCKDLRYSGGYGIRSLADEHSELITEAFNASMENAWRPQPSQTTTAFPLSSYPQLGAMGDLGQNNATAVKRERQQPLSFLGSGGDFDTAAKQEENQTLRPFFDEWPKSRDSWSDLSSEKSNPVRPFSAAATRLSISAPVTMVGTEDFCSDISITNSPNGYY